VAPQTGRPVGWAGPSVSHCRLGAGYQTNSIWYRTQRAGSLRESS